MCTFNFVAEDLYHTLITAVMPKHLKINHKSNATQTCILKYRALQIYLSPFSQAKPLGCGCFCKVNFGPAIV